MLYQFVLLLINLIENTFTRKIKIQISDNLINDMDKIKTLMKSHLESISANVAV